MASGKFSKPRPQRNEERQIEEAFRQVTGQSASPRRTTRGENTNIEYTPRHVGPPEPSAQEVPLDRAFAEETGFVPPADDAFPVPDLPPVEPELPPHPEHQGKFQRISQEMDRFFNEEIPEDSIADEEPAEPDLIDKLMAFWDKGTGFSEGQNKVILVGICAISLVVIIGFIAVLFRSTADPYEDKILNNVMAAGVNLGGMSKNQATAALKEAEKAYSQDMIVDFSGNQLRLTAKDMNPKLDIKALVNKAYDYGRSGTNAQNALAYETSLTTPYVIDISPYLSLNERYIKTTLESYAQEAGATLTQPSYGLEGEQPELSADKFDEHTPTQTLIITLGTPGIGFDAAAVYRQVLDAYYTANFLVHVEQTENQQDPDTVNLDAIYQEFYIAPVEATVDKVTQKTIPGSYGYEFDLESAKLQLQNAQFGDVLRIPMEYIAPKLLDDTSFFQDVLGQYQTRHNTESNRNTNLRLASDALNNTIVMPGEVFSFNSVVGQRTASRGYQMAWSDTTEYASEYIGGGVSQVSSTLLGAAMTADLEILSWNTGRYTPNFIEFGMDAEVGSSQDLTFRNSHTHPIRIQAQMSGGSVKIQILGTETRNYYVLMEQSVTQTIRPDTKYQDFKPDNPDRWEDGDVVQEGITGYTVKLYKVKYDVQTNRLLSRDYTASVTYRSEDQIVARVEVEETTVPTEPPTTAPSTIPTTLPTTAPTTAPTTQPTTAPTTAPTTQPTTAPTETATPPVTEATVPSSESSSEESQGSEASEEGQSGETSDQEDTAEDQAA